MTICMITLSVYGYRHEDGLETVVCPVGHVANSCSFPLCHTHTAALGQHHSQVRQVPVSILQMRKLSLQKGEVLEACLSLLAYIGSQPF